MTTQHIELLKRLSGCPDGATAFALSQHGFTAEAMNDLVEAGLARAALQRPGTDKIRVTVVRLWITDAGKQELANVQAANQN